MIPDDPDARAFANSIEIEEVDLPGLEPEQAGIVYYTPEDEGWTFAAVRQSGIDADLASTFDAWARERAYIIYSTGDLSVDGWFKRKSDESWQITARLVPTPDMSFLDE